MNETEVQTRTSNVYYIMYHHSELRIYTAVLSVAAANSQLEMLELHRGVTSDATATFSGSKLC